MIEIKFKKVFFAHGSTAQQVLMKIAVQSERLMNLKNKANVSHPRNHHANFECLLII